MLHMKYDLKYFAFKAMIVLNTVASLSHVSPIFVIYDFKILSRKPQKKFISFQLYAFLCLPTLT